MFIRTSKTHLLWLVLPAVSAALFTNQHVYAGSVGGSDRRLEEQGLRGRRNLKKVDLTTPAGSPPGLIRAGDGTRTVKTETSNEGQENAAFNMLFHLGGNGRRMIRVFVKPSTDEIEIREVGRQSTPGRVWPLDDNDRQFLKEAADLLESEVGVDTDTIFVAGTQSMRAARLLSEWPETLAIEFVFDAEAGAYTRSAPTRELNAVRFLVPLFTNSSYYCFFFLGPYQNT